MNTTEYFLKNVLPMPMFLRTNMRQLVVINEQLMQLKSRRHSAELMA